MRNEQDLQHIALVEEAVENRRRSLAEKQSIDEAKLRIPELQEKILKLLKIDIPKNPSPESQEAITERFQENTRKLTGEHMAEMDRRAHEAMLRKFAGRFVNFDIPIENEEPLRITVSKGERSRRGRFSEDSVLEVNIISLDYILRVDHNEAHIESKAHRIKPFDMHTPIGPGSSSDLGPKWRREMNMQDFDNFNAVLDRLQQPDVIRVDTQKP